MRKMMMIAPLALLAAGLTPAVAQQNQPGGNPTAGTGVTPPGVAAAEMRNESAMDSKPAMTSSEMAMMKKCDAMSSKKRMKNKACMKMHSGM